MEDQRPGAAYGIDHYVVAVGDLDRWTAFYTNVLGAMPRSVGGNRPARPEQGLGGRQVTVMGEAHLAGESQPAGLPTTRGLPGYRYFVRPGDIDEHLRRLDRFQVSHAGAVRTSEEGEEGTAIRFEDPDGNQLEFWAPTQMPDGGMDHETSARVGRIAGAVLESRNLSRTGDFYTQYCGLDVVSNADIPRDTLVFKFAAGGRLVFKQVEALSERTGGHIHALHTALILRGDEMMQVYEHMWADLPEWDHDPAIRPRIPTEEAQQLPARLGIHGGPIGPSWRAGFGRGDSFWDWDTNAFHWVPGAPVEGSMGQLAPELPQKYLDAHLASKQAR